MAHKKVGGEARLRASGMLEGRYHVTILESDGSSSTVLNHKIPEYLQTGAGVIEKRGNGRFAKNKRHMKSKGRRSRSRK